MSNFVVSARKYRPQTFESVVGQGSVTVTLKNAIKNHHLAQAFLFFGSRGVGKTTTARILAKTINCLNLSEDTEPCNKCDSCAGFNDGHSFNIFELDGASNNSVDDIRVLIDQVRIAPQIGKYRIFIIDEVHMLSAQAFNAFLKTLEEPPAHAIFILATTEKHKIIPTVLSRCQIFDFHRIQVNAIVKHLQGIAKKENITADEKALHIIAQKADGSLRDALSIFDQIVSFSLNNVTYEAVLEYLNVLDYDYYFRVTDAAIAGDIPQNLLIYNDILEKGFDGSQFLIGLAEHLRNLLVCKDDKTVELLEVPAEIKARYQQQAVATDSEFILVGLDLLRDAEIQFKSTKNKRLMVEISLMKFSSILSSLKKQTVS